MADSGSPYVVLARKYRPLSFESLIGQDAMVRTLTNAFAANRIHHAFILTGVRGVGKTTTARILARAFNYVDETGQHPTLDLETEGEHCRAIIEGRHVDVQEMDAASNTSIDDIREIIESVKYGPVSAPFKVFIIDEVHMLSNSAFNGLLKTLEEPPPYVKFIFATTEIRKVPVTILSRCQRFDLRRVPPDTMTAYLETLLEKEGVATAPEALAMIVRAGEGSVRDCQSLLDQAIAHGGGAIEADSVRAMLGLADRSVVIDLFEMLMKGDIAQALDTNRALYDSGAEPATVLADLADFTHMVTRLKLVPGASADRSLTPDEKARAPDLAQRLGIKVLTRTWQILLKGIEETARAGNALQSAEMVLVRLAHAADLPTPDEVLERLRNATPPDAAPPPSGPAGPGGNTQSRAGPRVAAQNVASRPDPAPTAHQAQAPVAETLPMPRSYEALVALAAEKRDLAVKHALETSLRPVSFAEGRIEVQLTERADPSIVNTLSARLRQWTGRNWMVTVDTRAEAPPTIAETRKAETDARDATAFDDPLVQEILKTFPGAKLVDVRLRDDMGAEMPEPEHPDPTDEED
ncbi:MAG: DNA polymerase III subunit gamma/tau [Alphaproteobacteria bacterium]|nr:DNA polymerase III subunit gamma/tau [Alphaproteobacteria bacterium]